MTDLTLTCPTCGKRADMCFEHGDEWKKRTSRDECKIVPIEEVEAYKARGWIPVAGWFDRTMMMER